MARMSRTNVAAVVVLGIGLLLLVQYGCSTPKMGVVTVETSETDDGYVLIAPYRIEADPTKSVSGSVQLINRDGETVHTWKTEAPVLVADLKEDGTLYVSMTPPLNHGQMPGFGTTGIIQRLSWEGRVLFEHRDPEMTIDFDVLPDGSIAYLRWDETPSWFAQGVQGGFPTPAQSVWTNEIVIVTPDNEEVWSWHMSDHISPSRLATAFAPRQDFSHANSIRYIEHNPLTHTPAFLVSVRHLSTVLLIDAASGELLWESPEGLYSFQHDATLLENGHLLVFDNGFARKNVSGLFSQVVEVALPNGARVWGYDGGTTLTGKAQFASSIMGGAQRLPNGNTLITLSTSGVVREVTPEGNVAWEYRHTRHEDGSPGMLFRVRAYSPEGTQWGSEAAFSSFFAGFCSR